MTEQDIKEQIENLNVLLSVTGRTNNCLQNIVGMLEQTLTLFSRCQFQVDDFVFLSQTPEISDKVNWGWMCGKHFLIKGARAKVVQRSFYNGKFRFYLNFDNETHKDHYGVIHPLNENEPKANYSFYENWLYATPLGRPTYEEK
jgi:hypothetical protein